MQEETLDTSNEQTINKEITVLQNKLIEQENKIKEYITLSQTIKADFINYKNRVSKEIEDMQFLAKKEIILDILAFKNNLLKAIDFEKNEQCQNSLIQLNNNLENILKRLGLQKIDCLNKTFDYNLCECVHKQNSNKENNNKTITILEDGYLLNNKLIKPAKVVVGEKED